MVSRIVLLLRSSWTLAFLPSSFLLMLYSNHHLLPSSFSTKKCTILIIHTDYLSNDIAIHVLIIIFSLLLSLLTPFEEKKSCLSLPRLFLPLENRICIYRFDFSSWQTLVSLFHALLFKEIFEEHERNQHNDKMKTQNQRRNKICHFF